MDVEAVKNTAAVYMEPVRPAKRAAAKSPAEEHKTAGKVKKLVLDAVSGNQEAKEAYAAGKPDQKEDAFKDPDKLKEAVSEANNMLKQTHVGCEFDYNETVNRITIKVYDKETKQVIREIPPEQSLKTLEKVWELAGILVDEKC